MLSAIQTCVNSKRFHFLEPSNNAVQLKTLWDAKNLKAHRAAFIFHGVRKERLLKTRCSDDLRDLMALLAQRLQTI